MILFVDEEKRIMDSYKLELEIVGYEVVLEHNVDNALQTFQLKLDEISLVILDIMMPPGNLGVNETNGGLRTGIRLYQEMRGKSRGHPIVIFTNVSDEEVEKQFRDEANCWFFRKDKYLPFELAEEVKKIIPLPSPQ